MSLAKEDSRNTKNGYVPIAVKDFSFFKTLDHIWKLRNINAKCDGSESWRKKGNGRKQNKAKRILKLKKSFQDEAKKKKTSKNSKTGNRKSKANKKKVRNSTEQNPEET